MREALHYKDGKSDKFWRVETEGVEMALNWGRAGMAGRYEIKVFDSEEKCEREAAKLAAAKARKGYAVMQDFNAAHHFYFDTDEYGLHRLTSNPVFREFFSNDLYYDCGDEEAPFGSDEGNDALRALEETLRRKPKISFADFPRRLIENEWGLTYIPPLPKQSDEELKAQAEESYHGLPGSGEILQTDQVVIAAALGQIKIMGKSEGGLCERALMSLTRMERMYRLLWNWNEKEPPYAISIMRRDIENFMTKRVPSERNIK